MSMHTQCPNCRFVFVREPGYFLGAIVIGYAAALPIVAALGFLVHFIRPTLDWTVAFIIGFVFYLGLTPTLFRYSRAIWMYIDVWLDPPNREPHL
jgi:uncharacterized membrane protein YraQ (UPF0718 family)